MTPYEKREEKDLKLVEELEQHARETSRKVGEERVSVNTTDGYLIIKMKMPDGGMHATKQHNFPQHLRGVE